MKLWLRWPEHTLQSYMRSSHRRVWYTQDMFMMRVYIGNIWLRIMLWSGCHADRSRLWSASYRHSVVIMVTSSNGNIFRVTCPLCGEFTGDRWFPRPQRPVTRSFDVFFDRRLNKWLSKQSWGCWFETSSCSLWRLSYDTCGCDGSIQHILWYLTHC